MMRGMAVSFQMFHDSSLRPIESKKHQKYTKAPADIVSLYLTYLIVSSQCDFHQLETQTKYKARTSTARISRSILSSGMVDLGHWQSNDNKGNSSIR